VRVFPPAVIALGLFTLVGCSSTTPAPELDVAGATRVVRAGLFLDDTQTECITRELAPDETRVALNTTTVASSSAQRTFADAVQRCVPPENLAEAYVNVIRSAAPAATDDQFACARTTITTMTGDDLALAYLVAVSPSAPAPLDTASLLERFTQGCGLGDLLTGAPPSTAPNPDASPGTTNP
jgi:hypothetical protein